MQTRRVALGGLASLPLASAATAQIPDHPPASSPLGLAIDAIRKDGRYLPLHALAYSPAGAQAAQNPEQWAACWGDETAALAHAARPVDPPLNLTGASAEDAVEAIVRASKGRRVVMINEAHVASRHRAFVGRVLRALRPLGFTHYAAETFINIDQIARVQDLRSGSQVQAKHGTYIVDPVFAETARQALELGYSLAGYEVNKRLDGATPQAQVAQREAAQTANLQAALDRAPQGRFLVHVGYSHLAKIPDRGGNLWFAARLKTATGIDPLCISQAMCGAFGPHAPDSAAAQAVLAQFAPKAPIVIRTSDGSALGYAPDGSDLAVYHPSLPDVDGRSGWLASDPHRRKARVRLPAPAATGPTLAQAIHADDLDPAIPADQYLIPAGQRTATFFLRPGKYRIRLETAAGFAPIGEAHV